MKAKLLSCGGEPLTDIELPRFFETEFRPDVILKAVNIERKNKRQPYGPNPKAGMRHAVSTWGKGRGVARVQRLTQGRRAAESPNTVGGRRAHPPRPEEVLKRKINKKEKSLALRSALAATANKELVAQRGHKFEEKLEFPIVVEERFEEINKIIEKENKVPHYTGELVKYLEKIGVGPDLQRAKKGKKIRAGKGKMRGRRYKIPTSVLIVATENSRLNIIARNLPGVDVVSPKKLSVSHLAPGGHPGRLTIYTEKALKEMEELYEKKPQAERTKEAQNQGE